MGWFKDCEGCMVGGGRIAVNARGRIKGRGVEDVKGWRRSGIGVGHGGSKCVCVW